MEPTGPRADRPEQPRTERPEELRSERPDQPPAQAQPSEEPTAPPEGSGGGINWIPAIASFIIPGVGQFMQGRYTWGAVWFVIGLVAWLLWIAGPFVHIGAAAEAAIYRPRPDRAE